MTMASTKKTETNPANRKISRPEDAEERRQGDATAATRLAVPKARIGGELAGEERFAGKDETADALKRAAENDRRS
jgi:hypothetical protein